jgi:hypothetical protein
MFSSPAADYFEPLFFFSPRLIISPFGFLRWSPRCHYFRQPLDYFDTILPAIIISYQDTPLIFSVFADTLIALILEACQILFSLMSFR